MRLFAFAAAAVSLFTAETCGADGGAGLVRHVLARDVFGESLHVDICRDGVPDVRLPDDVALPVLRGWKASEQRQRSAVLKGFIDIPATGEWTFRSANREEIRIDGIPRYLFDGAETVPIRLKKGRYPVERRLTGPRRAPWHPVKKPLEWSRDGGAFSSVPSGVWSHRASDRTGLRRIPSDVELKLRPERGMYLAYDADIPADGFYHLCIRRAGPFRWGVYVPEVSSVRVDGEEVRQFDRVLPATGIYDEETVPLWLTKGRHCISFFGPGSEKHLTAQFGGAPRVWLRRLAVGDALEDAKSLNLTQALPGESVFRKGEPVRWTVHRATLSAAKPVEIEFRAVRQFNDPDAPAKETGGVVWRKTVRLAPGLKHATAEVAFPEDLVGAFEYTLWQDGALAEGPWEFLVVDTAAKPAAPGPLRELESYARRVDGVDFGTEAPGGPHRIRDNGTSRVRRLENGLAYRYGTRRDKSMGNSVTDCDWFGCSLKTGRPGKTHVARFLLPNDRWRRFPLEILDPVTEKPCGSFVEIAPSGEAGVTEVLVPFWPNGTWADFLFIPSNGHNEPRGGTEPAVASIEVWECHDALPPPAGGWCAARRVALGGEQPDLSPEQWTTPPPSRWPDHGADVPCGGGERNFDYARWHTAWRRWGEFAAWQGVNALEWPVNAYSMAHLRTPSMPWAGGYWLGEGAAGRGFSKFTRNTFKLILLECERAGVRFWADMQVNYNVARVLAASRGDIASLGKSRHSQKRHAIDFVSVIKRRENATDAELEGAFLMHGGGLGGCLDPTHPVARRYLVHVYSDIAAAAARCGSPAFAGAVVRLWNGFSSAVSPWWCTPRSGYGDMTLARFVKETHGRYGTLADMGDSQASRERYLLDDPVRRDAWFTWRADKTALLWKAILAMMRRHVPDATLVPGESSPPTPALGTGIDPAKMPAGSGFDAVSADVYVQGRECNSLWSPTFASFDVRPAFAGKTPFERQGAKDAESFRPAKFYPRGLNTASGFLSAPQTAKPLALALAKGSVDRVFLGKWWSQPAFTSPLAAALRAYRAIPQGAWTRIAPPSEGISVAGWSDGKGAAYFVNVSSAEAKVRLPCGVTDLVSGERALTELELPPWGIRVVKAAQNVSSFTLAGRGDRGASLRLFNPSGRAKHGALAVVSLGELLARGCTRPDALRLFCGRDERPVQIDRRDKNGLYRADSKNFSPYDDVVFFADFAEGERFADYTLRWDGAAVGKRTVPFTVETNARPDAAHNWHVRVSATKDARAGWSVGLLETGIGEISVDGKVVMRPKRDGSCFFGWMPDHGYGLTDVAGRRLTVKPGRPHVVSSGPVRLLVGYSWSDAVDCRRPPSVASEKRDWGKALLPVARGLRRQRIWEFTAGKDEVVSRHLLSADEIRSGSLDIRLWLSTAFKESPTPIAEKRLYSAGKTYQGADGGKYGGEFTGARYGKDFLVWDVRLGAGYGLAMDPNDAGVFALEFGTFFGCHLSATKLKGALRREFRMPVGFFATDPGPEGARDRAAEALLPPPEILWLDAPRGSTGK